ncbi:MAG TPA: LptA/OstA family protein [Caulobacteraceae bacterium]|nr:LptA/OstA family protein [Caulobacteraceae bacterium]
MRTAAALTGLLLVVASGGPAAAQLTGASNGPIDVSSEQLEVKNAQCLATYSGHVEALQGTSRLRAQVLNVYAKVGGTTKSATAPGGVSTKCGDIDRLEAHGSVYYVTPNEIVKGDDAVYQADAKTITITGDVVITQGKNVVVGSRLVINTQTQQATMESGAHSGRVRSVIYPGANSGGVFGAAPANR